MVYGTGATEPGDPDTRAAVFEFAHIGLPPSALYGRKKAEHLKKLHDELVDLLLVHDVYGICLCEVGDSREGLPPDLRDVFTAMVHEAFRDAGAAEPSVYWGGSCMSAFLPTLIVQDYGFINELDPNQTWRGAQVFKVVFPNDPEELPVVVVNSHQPSSRKHPYSDACRENVVTNLVSLGDRVILGNDLNIVPALLARFLWDEAQSHSVQFCFSTEISRQGDIVIVMGLEAYQDDCLVENRDPAHDPVIVR